MARLVGPTTRLSRREGVNLQLKPVRDQTGKHPLEREYKNYPPGMHMWRRGKTSDYAVRLREKQKVKRHYGVLEKQFRRYFEKAESMKGNTGLMLLQLLERRLDNVVYKTALSPGDAVRVRLWPMAIFSSTATRSTSPAIQIQAGDVISINPREKSQQYARAQMALLEGVPLPPSQAWLEIDENKMTAKVLTLPTRDDVIIPVEEQLIVEFCSR
jgi:small subunit ribosomal protein S4